MHKYELLRLRAEEFRVALVHYAEQDKDLQWFLERWMPWYERIMQHEVRLPCYEYKMGVYFFSMGEITPNLFERYVTYYDNDRGLVSRNHPLANAARNFEDAIRDAYSDPNYVTRLRQAGELPDLVPDEPPPPEEETLLPPKSLPVEAKKTMWQSFKGYGTDLSLVIKAAKKNLLG